MSSEKHRAFVFYDPTGKRWMRFRRTLQSIGIIAGMTIFLIALSMWINPQLPVLGLPPVQHLPSFKEVRTIIGNQRAAKNVPFRMHGAARHIKYIRSGSPVIHPKLAARVAPDHPIVFGYYVNWDPASMVSLRLNLQHLTHLVPEWLTLQNAQGDIEDDSDLTVIEIAKQAHLPILAMVTNFRDGWQADDVHKILNDSGLRSDLVENICSNLVEHKFAGVNLDFEGLSKRDRAPLVAFLRQLSAKLKPAGLLLTESVPADDPAYDLKALAEIADYIVPMVYDEHYQSGVPGPVASEEWFQHQIDRLADEVPAKKTVIGIGDYGYDWIIGSRGSAEVTFGNVMSAAVTYKAPVQWDKDQENPVLRYRAAGQQHEVWFLDAVTALNQVHDASDAGFRGIGLWRLGAEDPGIWTVLKPESWPDEKYDARQLAVLTAEKSVEHYGDGEVLRIVETPHNGNRIVMRDPDGDYSERYGKLPSYYVVERSGFADRKWIALSFDDGPDPQYTPEILDLLQKHNVPATFFVVGVNAEQYPALVRRIYAAGDEIGNHTYSHPNIAATSEERTRLELSTTQRIIENATGVSTTLFRPPYNADSEPQTPAEILPILRAQQLRYITIGESIDPRDWQKGSTAEGIFSEIKAEQTNGHIILLHDGGGLRSATVAALPRIIGYFQSQGYRFVTVGDLLGMRRSEVMPAPSANEMRWAHIEGGAFGAHNQVKKVAGMLFLWAIFLTVLRSLVFGALAIVQKRKARRRRFDPDFQPPVSVVVAAFNEEKVIAHTIDSILANGYPALEIVVVNDGSRDATLQVLRERFAWNPRVRILTQPNSGKSGALNNGIAHTAHDIVVTIDADTVLQHGAIAKLARHFADSEIGAVSGNARVGNRKRWITRFQSIEYIYGFNLDRRALDLLNAITVVPGAIGAWRKDLILRLGGFGHDTLAEDTDLTLAIRRLGYTIRYEEQAVAYTEAPEDTRSLARQRFRWAFGTLQAAWKHRDAMFLPRYGSLGFVALPSIWLFQVLLSALSPFAELAMIVALFAGNWPLVLLYYVAFFVLELLTGVLAYALEGEKPWDLALLFFQRIYYRELMYYVLAKTLLYAMRGRLVGWGKLERRATVHLAQS